MNIDPSIIVSLQTQEWAATAMRFASTLGSLEFMLLLMPFLYWCWDSHRGFRLGLILVFCYGFNSALKLALHSPRPYWIYPDIRGLGSEATFGMPSAHAQNAVCIWGLTARFIQQPWAYALAIGTCIIIGVSRLYLGVHLIEDVIAGWAVGALLLGLFIAAEPILAKRLGGLDLRQQIIVSIFATLSILALYAIGLASMGSWHLPADWAVHALKATGRPINPTGPLDAFRAAGLLFGVSLGYAVIQKKGGFLADGPATSRLIRYILGITGVIIIWYGPGGTGEMQAAGYIQAYVQSMLAGLWVILGAPLLFIKLNLAEREKV